MSDAGSETIEVERDVLDSLIRRVADLEQRVDELEGADGRSESALPGVDHRDRAVLDAFTVGEHISRRGLVKTYLRTTDITNEKTARNRARQLVRRGEFFRDDGSRLVFEGVGDDD